jgi:hypothetical protein
MSMIFPGMDPYLENPRIWPGVHNRLIVYIADHLQPRLQPRYVAAIEERVYLEGPNREVIPDVWLRRDRDEPREAGEVAVLVEDEAPVLLEIPPLEVHESYVTILDLESDQQVVTVIEVVSPTNKFAGEGRKSYLDKQREVRATEAHLVEIDLLRAGTHVLAVPEWAIRGRGPYDYLACVNRNVGVRGRFEAYPMSLRRRLKGIAIPLAGDDPDVRLDLQAVLDQTYEAGRYRGRIKYDKPCVPPLSADDQGRADALIREANPAR